MEHIIQPCRAAFAALFGNGQGRDWYRECRVDLSALRIRVASDDPSILAWPWEALESDEDGCIAWQCHMERQLCEIPDALPLGDLPDKLLMIFFEDRLSDRML